MSTTAVPENPLARMIPIVPVGAAPAGDVGDSLYEVHQKIYPRAVSGWFMTWRWLLVWATQLVFYGLPWLRWDSHPLLLFDLEARKFYVGGLILWPQDIFLLTLLLISAALGLFLFTAIAGRLWCGYACPQTVYTELFLWIERAIQGDRHQQMRLDQGPRSIERIFKKSATHVFWIALSLWTGLTLVGYFTPIRQLVPEIWDLKLGPWETFWILFYGFATYGNAGFMREQVCKYMCPYARFQSAMIDSDSLIITYDSARGEPRGSRSRHADAAALGLGACVNCGVCVEVCPTGIDIRHGLQYECIGCAACVDGCNQIMDRMGYARGLIRYTTERALAEGFQVAGIVRRIVRPRVVVYAVLLAAVVAGIGFEVLAREPIKVDVMRDRAVLARTVQTSGGTDSIENVYRLQVMNQDGMAHRFQISATGMDGLTTRVAGEAADQADRFDLPAASSRQIPISVRVPSADLKPGVVHIRLRVSALDDPKIATDEATVFLVPADVLH
jgi:cytochrome c oxidase accessory protein FixG